MINASKFENSILLIIISRFYFLLIIVFSLSCFSLQKMDFPSFFLTTDHLLKTRFCTQIITDIIIKFNACFYIFWPPKFKRK